MVGTPRATRGWFTLPPPHNPAGAPVALNTPDDTDPVDQLERWIQQNGIDADVMRFDTSCHSVADAVAATGAGIEAIVKNLCMIADDGDLIVAILPGAERASTTRVGKALEMPPPRMATADEVLARSGYPAGGTPSFGFSARFVVDPQVMDRDIVYTGGGSDRALVRIAPSELLRANAATVARVRK